jgi:hypothetical protein
MKNLTIALFLMVGLNTFAQNTDRAFLVINETKVKDMTVFRNTQAIHNPYQKESLKDIIFDRGVQRSESGIIYFMTFINGAENLGKYVARTHSGEPSKFNVDNPKIAQEMSANWDASNKRSTWIRVNSLIYLPKDFKRENYKFRKVIFRSVPYGQQEAYEKNQAQQHELELKLGINQLSVTYKAVDGNPVNTYMTFLPDNSIVDFYTHNVDRNQKRSNSKEFSEFWESRIKSSIIRTDHLFLEF